MPELPEVETVRLGLVPLIGRRIATARAARRDVVRAPDGARRGRIDPADLLAGDRIADLRRRGKQLAILGDRGPIVLVHLGMSGRLLLMEPDAPAPGHAHVRWSFDDGRTLVFADPRRFGGVWLIDTREGLDERWAALGPDALVVTGAQIRSALGGSSRAIKPALLDQRALAGVGNIYADEALFDARIAPTRPCRSLAGAEWTRLASSVRRVLGRAVRAGGSTLRDYRRPDGSRGDASDGLKVYARAGRPCVRCGQPLSRTTLAQRTTSWCARCQA